MNSFQIEVPATINLGPGLESLALALNVVDTVRVDLDEGNLDLVLEEVRGPNVPDFDPEDNEICRAYRHWATGSDQTLPGARFSVESRIPFHHGFGSSAATAIAGLAAGAAATDYKHPTDRLLRLASEIVGQTGNSAAAVLGGLIASFGSGEDAHWQPVASHLDLGVALLIPEDDASGVPHHAASTRAVSRSEWNATLGRVAFLTASFAWGRWDRIGAAMTDSATQENLDRDFPHLAGIISAATSEGAYGAGLVGGGSAIVGLCPPERTPAIIEAMERCATSSGWEGAPMQTSVRCPGMSIKRL